MTSALGRISIIADDAAINRGIDTGIEDLAVQGVLTSVCAFATAPDLLQQLTRRLPREIELGLHFNLSSGPPVSPPSQIPSLVSTDGVFHSPAPIGREAMGDSIRTFLSKRVSQFEPDEVRLELRAQVASFCVSAGRSPAFVALHHDLDHDPALRHVTTSELPALPGRQERLASGDLTSVASLFLSPSDSTESATAKITRMLSDAARRCVTDPSGCVEVVCHPGLVDDELPRFTVYTSERNLELQAWSSASVRRVLAAGARAGAAWMFDRHVLELGLA